MNAVHPDLDTRRPAPPLGATTLEAHVERRIAARALELPVLPEVATRVMTMTAEEGCSMVALAGVIRRDPAMASHFLRIANSPAYRPTSPVVTLQQALARLGTAQIRQMALLITCKGRVFSVPGYEGEVRALFQHSLASALFAQEIARARRWNVEEAFLCGLLHDVGRPVLLQLVVDVQRELRLKAPFEIVEALCAAHHARVGSELLTHWGLPAQVAETVRFHHDPTATPAFRNTALMTGLADDLAHLLLETKPIDEHAARSHPLLGPLNLYADELDALLAKREIIAATVEAIA
jgi:putative nucleotidyltransferase with HDIG domain